MEISQPSQLIFLKIHTFSPTQTICISNESWNHSEFKSFPQNMIGFEKTSKIHKINFFLNENFWRKKILNVNFSKKKFYDPPIFFSKIIINTKNEKYTKIIHSQLRPKRHGKRSKQLRADSAPPPFLGLTQINLFYIFLPLSFITLYNYFCKITSF